jgi:hypothetical protein
MYVAFCPNIELITSTRRFVAELFDSMITDPDAVSRVALTIHELLENTLKYSTDGMVCLQVTVSDIGGSKVVKICASNRANPTQLGELKRRIDALRDTQDPMAFYVSMMIDSAGREDGSGLGLARIRVEGEMDLAYTIDGDVITITAATPVELQVPS